MCDSAVIESVRGKSINPADMSFPLSRLPFYYHELGISDIELSHADTEPHLGHGKQSPKK